MWSELDDARNDAVRQNWDILANFCKVRLNDLRYLPRPVLDSKDSEDDLLDALDDPQDGVMTWLSKHP